MYPDLYRIIGITYGPGDSSTTFNLPNLLGRFPEGSNTAGLVKEAGAPNITGTYIWADNTGYGINNTANGAIFTGAFKEGSTKGFRVGGGNANGGAVLELDASRSSSVYKNDVDTVQPPAVTVRYMIKAFNAATPDSSLVDMTQYANDLANRLTREMTPAFNKRVEITTSGTFTAPVTGWYKFTIKGAGGGGAAGYYQSDLGESGEGGGEGGTTFAYEKMLAGETATITIGAGGAGGTTKGGTGGVGGNTSISVNANNYTAYGGGGGGAQNKGGNGTINGSPGGAVILSLSTTIAAHGSSGGGSGAGRSNYAGINGGGGGGGNAIRNSSFNPGGDGGDGYVFIEYFDPTLQ